MRGLEVLELKESGENYSARVALNGRLAVPFEFPKSVRFENFPDPEEFEAFLARQGQALIEAYGDARM